METRLTILQLLYAERHDEANRLTCENIAGLMYLFFGIIWHMSSNMIPVCVIPCLKYLSHCVIISSDVDLYVIIRRLLKSVLYTR
jgi:hypothetical protein